MANQSSDFGLGIGGSFHCVVYFFPLRHLDPTTSPNFFSFIYDLDLARFKPLEHLEHREILLDFQDGSVLQFPLRLFPNAPTLLIFNDEFALIGLDVGLYI
jgi:hypothetical protein